MSWPTFLLTPGDPAGIGPEITWKLIQSGITKELGIHLLAVGPRAPFKKMGVPLIEVHPEDPLSFKNDGSDAGLYLLAAPEKSPRGRFLPGYQSGWAIEKAVSLLFEKDPTRRPRALVTGPISKERLQSGGYPYDGHTEMLAELCSRHTRRRYSPTMMLANDLLRVSLVTTHLALKEVPRAVTPARLKKTILHTAEFLRDCAGISKPRIAVCALNPHAGEAGIFGKEEIRVITPALKKLKIQGRGSFELFGPAPADTLFAQHRLGMHPQTGKAGLFDAVVGLYHDQALIPVKLLDFPRTVNITLGLPLLRTSVDHGVGFDIAGQGKADPSSLISALRQAVKLADRRIE